MSFENATASEEGVFCQDSDGRTALFEYAELDKDLPDFDKLIKEFEPRDTGFIGITPKLITILEKAMHTDDNKFRIRFNGVDKGMLVDCPAIPDQVALLMPALIDDSLF